ncbi:MAG: multidrug efflux pump subunit AcrB [Cognaticolwellia sp.]|jgi:multidrug efflux pump subunit AcrB
MGYPTQVVAVDLNLEMLKHYGISMFTINSLLQKRAMNITPGFFDANTRRFNVKTSGNFQHIDELNNTVVFSNDTGVIRLKDVTSIDFSSREPSYLAYYDTKPVIFLTVEQIPIYLRSLKPLIKKSWHLNKPCLTPLKQPCCLNNLTV